MEGMFGWLDEEKRYWLISAVPPVFLCIWICYLLRRSPGPIIESLASVVPGLQKPEFRDGMACLRLEASADVIRTMNNVLREHQAMMTSDLKALGVDHRILSESGAAVSRLTRRFTHQLNLGRQLEDSDAELPQQRQQRGGGLDTGRSLGNLSEDQDLEDGGLQEQSSKQEVAVAEREVWVNPKHLNRMFLIPSLFVGMYFWDACVIAREVSYDFPLSNCMGDSLCFYNTQDYSMTRWPKYKKLDCETMTERTVASDFGFYYTAPKDARFYKCYTWVFTPQNLIQATGDVVALWAMNTLVILYFCVDFSPAPVRSASVEDTTPQATSVKKLRHQHCWVMVKQAIFAVVGIISLWLVPRLYGKWTNQFEGYLGIPGACLFAFILLNCRKETLSQRIAELKKEDSDASGSSSSEDGGPPSPSAPVAAAAAAAGSVARTAAGRQPLLDVPGAGYQPMAVARGLPPPVARSAGDAVQLTQATGLHSGGIRH